MSDTTDARAAGSRSTSTAGRGKVPRTRLAGPYGHPFHPILVTVPIGAWVSSLVFDVASHIAADDASTLATGALWLVIIGILGALLAAVFGLIDLSGIRPRTKAFRAGTAHLALNTTVVVLYAVNAGLRLGDDGGPTATGPLVLSIVALGILGASGWLGGQLAYHYGVRVADDGTQAEAFR